MGTDRKPPQDSPARMRQPGGRTGADIPHGSLRREPYRQASPSQCAAIRVPARTFPEEPGQSIPARSAACGRGLGLLLIP
jgi:hypothetical protein